jgi:hypothetical protein
MVHVDDLIKPGAKQILLAVSRRSRGRISSSPDAAIRQRITNQICKESGGFCEVALT